MYYMYPWCIRDAPWVASYTLHIPVTSIVRISNEPTSCSYFSMTFPKLFELMYMYMIVGDTWHRIKNRLLCVEAYTLEPQ